jgi:hypothetical protein
MATLIRRNQGEVAPSSGSAFDPFRVMRDVLRWDPFRELEAAGGGEYSVFAPSFDVKENKEGYVFRADLPGVREEDLEISPDSASRKSTNRATRTTPASAPTAGSAARSRCPTERTARTSRPS